jgi:hypothetical protein
MDEVLVKRDIPGLHWQKGFFDEQKWVYVRDNPVRAG